MITNHAKKRTIERCNVGLQDVDYFLTKLTNKIINNQECFKVKESFRYCIYIVKRRGTYYKIIFNPKTNTIVTIFKLYRKSFKKT